LKEEQESIFLVLSMNELTNYFSIIVEPF